MRVYSWDVNAGRRRSLRPPAQKSRSVKGTNQLKPIIIIGIADGVVVVVSDTPGLHAILRDQDAARVGETFRSVLESLPPEENVTHALPVTEAERRRLDVELRSNHGSTETAVEVLMNIISDVSVVAAFRERAASGRSHGDPPEADPESTYSLNRESTQTFVKSFMYPLKIGFDVVADDETDPHERVLTFQNGLPVSHPFSDYRGGKIRITLFPDNRIEVELYGLSEGVTVYVPTKAMPPVPPVEACWVHARGGAFLVLDDHVADFVDYSWLHPGVVDLIEREAEALGQRLQWGEDVDDLVEELAQLSAESGISEREILQQLLKDGRLKRRR